MNTNETFALRHVESGRYYSHMTLGADVMTEWSDRARKWKSAAAAAKFAARFGDRYEVVSR